MRNTSLPPKAQFSSNTFEIAIPTEQNWMEHRPRAREDWARTRITCPGERALHLQCADSTQQRREGNAVRGAISPLLHAANTSSSPHLQMPADNLVIYVAKGIEFAAARGVRLPVHARGSSSADIRCKGIHPGQAVSFMITGEGQMPREAENGAMGQPGGAAAISPAGGQPGGGLGVPIDAPDPLTNSKGWILGACGLLLAGCAFFFIRKKSLAAESGPSACSRSFVRRSSRYSSGFHVAPRFQRFHATPIAIRSVEYTQRGTLRN